jgi:hypothetical protein
MFTPQASILSQVSPYLAQNLADKYREVLRQGIRRPPQIVHLFKGRTFAYFIADTSRNVEKFS